MKNCIFIVIQVVKEINSNSGNIAKRKPSLTRLYSGDRPSSYKRDQQQIKTDIDALRIDGDRLYDPKQVEITRNLPNGGSQSSKNNSVGRNSQNMGGSSRKGSARLFEG